MFLTKLTKSRGGITFIHLKSFKENKISKYIAFTEGNWETSKTDDEFQKNHNVVLVS